MTRALELSNSDNWELIHNENTSAVLVPKIGGGFIAAPIPEISIAVLLNVFVVAVRVATDIPEGRVWKFAGHLKQNVSTGIAFENSQDASFSRRQPLFLDKINLVVFPRISSSYSISIQVPDWFLNASVALWRYTGPDYDSDLARIEQKIDDISNYGAG
ncbi:MULTISPECIES: hypothetical protein [unclassified Nostoc]|uniref:hypothetical protein n=1 Tax=unclassified Nostoc TaxID=2593658 RepID=UPI002AD58E20|nr:hypothetical protein [Nostoc sp. DedQUE03]MDZ7974846.1 hypothetical protein [Nostoc sp. DedQUE03]MDZ8043008.1 hypothetical protein [Nostoc sp. DedQUE02]